MEEILEIPDPDQYMDKIISNMDFEKYLGLEGYLHSSDLKLMSQSINHFLSKTKFKVTDGLRLGQLGHTMCLEMDLFNDRFLVCPKLDKRITAQKAEHQRLVKEAEEQGKILISQDEFIQAQTWKDNLLKDPVCSNVFQKQKGENEVSGFYRHPIHGCKGAFRVDKLLRKEKLAIDLKIMQSAHPYKFALDVKKYRYDIQAAWYLDGLTHIEGGDWDFIFVVCEKTTPFNVQAYRLDKESIDKAREDIGHIIKKYTDYLSAPNAQKERLTGYRGGIETLNIKWFE